MSTEAPDTPLAVCVFCASSTTIAPEHLDTASELGEEIARRGWILVTGGGTVGSMGAIARAARAAGGHTIGVIPRVLLSQEVADHDADELVVTDDMRERKGVMDSRSNAFIALAGGLGTLEELLEVWVSRTLGMHAKPVVILDPEETYAGLHDLVTRLAEGSFVRAEALGAVHWVTTVGAALDLCERGRTGDELAPEPTPEEVLEAEP